MLAAAGGDPAQRRVIDLVRDEIKLKDQEARAEVIDRKRSDGRSERLGWITLPSFYADLNRTRGRESTSTTRDVSRLLARLKQEGIQGLVIDLRRNGGGSLEEAVKRVTSDAASAYRINDRGRLVPGAWADLLLFDPATVGRGAKRRVHDLPTGADRLDTGAVGVHGVWVNGVRTVNERGVIADCGRPGRVLREF